MASTNDTASTVQADPASSQRRGGYSGGRGRGRGDQNDGFRGGFHNNGHGGFVNDRSEDRPSRGPFRGRGRGGRGRGRGGGGGGRDRALSLNQQQSSATAAIEDQDGVTVQPPPLPGGGGVFGGRLTKDAEKNAMGETKEGEEEEEVEAEVCFICASLVVHNSVAPCNHRTCHICALRLRALYKTKACAHCRTEAATVIFTDDAVKRFEDFKPEDFSSTDQNLGICYEKSDIYEDTVLLLRYNCPDPDCDVACMGWPDLHRHVRSVHHKVMCDLCTRNKKVFTHEHELFTQQELRRHEKFGDDNPGAVDQSGFKGHPECGFCRQRFYGDDELYAHCREKHERCHVCDRRDEGRNPQYYVNYDALEAHFRKDHYMCLDQECLEKKFVVFDSEMDLKAHQLEQHPNGLSKDARRDARRVDISSFQYREPHVEITRGGRRGRGRGRDPNAEPLPPASAQPMGRAEMAHHRAMQIQSAQSVTTRNFGGQLSQPEPEPRAQTVRQPQHTRDTSDSAAAHSRPPAAAASPRPSSPARPTEQLTPQEQARRLRHAAVTERAANLLRNDNLKLTEFRERISAYRLGTLSASDLIEAFFALFDTSSQELGKLVKELADIFEVTGKRDGLLKAWSDWKAINEDYPSLPGPSGPSTAASILGSGGSRVLKLKSSTAQSSRSAVSRHGSWGSATAPNASTNGTTTPFPALGSRAAPAKPAPTPHWLALRPSATTSSASSARASPAPSRTQSSTNLPKADAFPALPPGKKPTASYFSPGYTGSGVLRQGGGVPVSAWAAGGGSGGSNGGSGAQSPAAAAEDDGAKKGKGRKKQVLMGWG